ncbi:MAG TPA: hypothetical protein PKA39_02400 [Ignavibacteria bacterium]|jgi:hypothetical protein|nr:hypothetical protein [Ignavibacteria bacterium]
MKRIFGITALLLLNFLCGSVYCQESYSIPESGETVICGRTVIVDAIWFSEGIIRADISILETPRSKPITGGYMAGDLITITSEPGCSYYVNSIMKSGLPDSKGNVVLSTNPLVQPIQQCADEMIMDEGQSYKIDTLDWHIASIRNSDAGKLSAFITSSFMTEKISEFEISQNDRIWLSGCLYEAADLMSSSKDIMADPDIICERLPGSLRLKKVK